MGRLRSSWDRSAYGAWGGTLKAAALTLFVAQAGPAAAQGAGDAVQVLALGDSLTAGYGLTVDEGFVAVLNRWLDENGVDAEVVNAGVSGDTTAGGRARLGWSLTDEVDAAIVALGGNDLLRGIDPATSRENLDAILGELAGRDLPALLVGIEAPGNYGPGYKAAFDGMYVDLAAEHGALLETSFLGPLLAEAGDVGSARAAYLQPDGIHPNAAGVEVIVEALGPRVAELVDRVGAGS